MKLPIYKTLTLLSFLILVISACEKDLGTIEELDSQNINAYIKKNTIDVQQFNNTGIYYKILTPGTGPAILDDQQVGITYTIRSIDGKYSAVDTVFSNRFANFVGYLAPAGLKTGVMDILKKSNSQIRLIIPSKLAYGRNGDGRVPGNASIDIVARVIDKASIPKYDDGVIKQFLQVNNLTGFTKSPTGLYYKISSPGTGTTPITVESEITISYTGKLLDGRLFDSSTETTFNLEDLIAGWREGIPMLKEGGSIRLVVPSSLAYGFPLSNIIPPFACLDFEITVKKAVN